MLKIAVAEYNQRLGEIVKSFPAQLLVVADELIPDLIRTGRVDITFTPYSLRTERKFIHRIIQKFPGWLVIGSSNISAEKQILLEEFLLRVSTSFNAEKKYLLRLVSSIPDADNITRLLNTACMTDVFVAKSDTLVRFETVTDFAAYYDIVTQLHESGARQISLISIDKIY